MARDPHLWAYGEAVSLQRVELTGPSFGLRSPLRLTVQLNITRSKPRSKPRSNPRSKPRSNPPKQTPKHTPNPNIPGCPRYFRKYPKWVAARLDARKCTLQGLPELATDKAGPSDARTPGELAEARGSSSGAGHSGEGACSRHASQRNRAVGRSGAAAGAKGGAAAGAGAVVARAAAQLAGAAGGGTANARCCRSAEASAAPSKHRNNVSGCGRNVPTKQSQQVPRPWELGQGGSRRKLLGRGCARGAPPLSGVPAHWL